MKTSVMDVGRLLWALSGRGVEKQIAKLRGVKCATVNYVTGSANVVYDQAVTDFEQMLVRSGIRLIKYYLDISKAEQRKRLRERARDPLTQWKVSSIDGKALKQWGAYSRARNAMLARTHHEAAPWKVVRAGDKYLARLNVIKDLLFRLDYCDKYEGLILPDPATVVRYEDAQLRNGLIAP